MAIKYINKDSGSASDSNSGADDTTNAWATIAHGLGAISAFDTLAVRKATTAYSISTGLTCSVGGYTGVTDIIGYGTTVGDAVQPTILATAAIVGFSPSAENIRISNFIFDGGSTGTQGFVTSGYGNVAMNCTFQNWTGEGVSLSNGGPPASILKCTVTGCGGTNGAVINGGIGYVLGCKIYSNTKTGVYFSGSYGAICDNLIYSNSGGSSDGIYFENTYQGLLINGNTCHANGRDGIRCGSIWRIVGCCNNILTLNGGYGLNANGAAAVVDGACDYNWFGSGGLANVSGPRNIILAGPHDLSGDPQYVNAAAGDFTPQNAAVQAGFP